MDKQIPDPIKQMRQKHASDAKRLAAEQRQRSGVLKERSIREAEAVEKAANEKRPKTPLTEDPSGAATNTKEQQPDPLTRLPAAHATGDTTPQGPTGTQTEDPEILPDKVTKRRRHRRLHSLG
jgi:hypothetical protein